MKDHTRHIIIIHGWASHPEKWLRLKEKLELQSGDIATSRLRIHVPFLPGFDPKFPARKPLTVGDYVIWLKKYLKKENVYNPILVGHSNGGRIAIHFAATDKNVAGLVLVGAAGIPDTNTLTKRALFKLVASAGKKILTPFRETRWYWLLQKLLYKTAGESDYLIATPIMKKTMLNMLNYDVRNDTASIQCPTLCIWGDKDNITPSWMGKELQNRIKQARLTIILGGHNIHISNPAKLAQLISEFVTKQL